MQTIMITGGTGFLGRHLALKLKSTYNVILTGRNNLQNSFARKVTGCEVVPMDITNIDAVREMFHIYHPDIVIHAAATKYVDLSEIYPNECIDINIKGSQNIVRAAIDKGIGLVVGISTDKASPPALGVYAKSKAIMEKLFLLMDSKSDTRFFCLRFGNIAWSTGSVFPLWTEMINKNGLIESTGSHMRRFMFSIDEACGMVLESLENIEVLKGKVLAKKMKKVEMSDVLNVFSTLYEVNFIKTDARIGENIDETMIGIEECPYTYEWEINGNMYYIIDYKQKSSNCISAVVDTLNSEKLTLDEIRYLIVNKSQS
jgi:UDP-glucose 4-epimerase